MVLPREIVTAAFVVAAFEKMPEHHRRFPCFVRNARHALGHTSVVKILAIGAAKNMTALPKRKALVENELGDEKQYMLAANIRDDLWLVHPGGIRGRRASVAHFTADLQEKDVRALEPKRRKARSAEADNLPVPAKGVFPENVEECNGEKTPHAGLRRVAAAAVCLAEIKRAALENRQLNVKKALSLVETDVSNWPDYEHAKRHVVCLWQADGQYYVNLMCPPGTPTATVR